MIIIRTSLLFMAITNAYPAINPLARYDHRTSSDSHEVYQGRCSIFDPTLSIHPFTLSDGESRLLNCSPGNDCLYVCKSGYLPSRLDSRVNYDLMGVPGGKVSCDSQGILGLTPGVPLCLPSKQNIYVTSLLRLPSSFCQKVSFEGNSFFSPNFLQPRLLSSIAVSDNSYGSSLYYFNSPGVASQHECSTDFSTTGTGASSPYVLEVTKDPNNHVLIRLGWNPFYVTDDYLNKHSPGWGMKVLCEGVDCSQPCYIDPIRHAVNQCENCEQGYGGSSFCTVKVPENMEAVVFLFSSDNGQHTNSFTGFSSFEKTHKFSVTGRVQTSGFRETLDSKGLAYTGKDRNEKSEVDKLKQEDEELTKKEKELLEEAQRSRIENKLPGNQDEQFHQQGGSKHDDSRLFSTESAKEFMHHENNLKSSLNGVKNEDAVDLVYLKISGGNNKDIDDFKGFLDEKSLSLNKESAKDTGALNDVSSSISTGNSLCKTDKCKSLLTSITESAYELCSLLKSEHSSSNLSKKSSNPQLKVAPTDLESSKQENSATDIKTNTHWILILLGIIMLL
ncbi:hypothetical protein PNEG_00664 [Pneumocystis murina B123]|uniref:Uncharacterized protein n=1 Tax=Pneumocystis murina (strain B123) TaxID=1069680 RepID=M7NUT5_PNEMU|nr:hypothetical protein PNEG_00664 [Pneumocystis murina B123]EMR11067.1 hypothetical protein PNEG_00664 [Pneumocystis murina B123]